MMANQEADNIQRQKVSSNLKADFWWSYLGKNQELFLPKNKW